MWFLALVFALTLQDNKSQGTDWDKVRSKLIARIQGENIADRLPAVHEAIATKDPRAFDILRSSLIWAEAQRKSAKASSDPLKKELNEAKDQYNKQKSERDSLVRQKKLSPKESERLQSLNETLNELNRSIEEKKRAAESSKGNLANLEQVEAAVREGFITVFRDSPPPLYDNYRKALTNALDYPGNLSNAPLYVEVLGKSGRKENFPYLENILKDAKGSDAVYKAAATAMLQTGGRQGIESLINFLAFPNSSVRNAAYEALKASTQQPLPLDQAAWQKWWKEKK